MTATTDHHKVLCDDSLSGGLARTLPFWVNPSAATLQSRLKGDTQAQPATRHANASAENAALVALAMALGEAPHTVCQVLAEKILALLKAGSAGVSVLSVQSDDGVLVSWPAIAGRWQAHSGSSRLLLAPATPAATLEPAAEHCLVVPFGVGGTTNGATGTVWAVTHDAASGFDAEDLRQLQNLALFAAPALRAMAARDPAPPTHRATPARWVDGTAVSQHDSFNSLIQNAPFGVYVVDAKFCLCQASAAAHKAFATVQPLIGSHFGDVVRAVWPEPFASKVLAHFRRTLDSGVAYAEPTLGEVRKDTPEIESYDWKIERIVLSDGGFGVVCYFFDLTERQQAAEALRLRTAQFETLFNEAPLGIYLVDADLRICQVNPQALPEFGNIQGLIGSELAAVMQTMWGQARGDEIVRQFRHTLNTGESLEAEELIALRADRGTTAYYEWQTHRIPLPDGSHGVVCHFCEISARVQSQAELRKSEMRFRAFVTASADIVYRMSFDFREILDLVGRNLVADSHVHSTQWMQDYVHPQDRQRVQAAIEAAIATKSIFELEHCVLRPNGELGWVRTCAVPLLDADGTVMEWFGAASDITERKRGEEERLQLVARLQQEDQRKDEFLATLAHELRNPLAPIRTGLQIMRLAPDDAAANARIRAMMERQLEQMVHLIDDLLDLSRISCGKIDLRKERIDLATAIQQAIEASRPLIAQADHELLINFLPGPIHVDADPTRLAQVFANLLNNAAKFTDRGGQIRLNMQRLGAEAVVSIQDNGIGIPIGMLPHVFEMFTQVDSNLERSHGGLGIGLSIVKRLVEMHGGSVEARSNGQGRGSEFVVRLPVALSVTGDEPTNQRDPVYPTTRHRILVVDDNVDAADLLSQLLEVLGNEVITFYDAESGIRAARKFRPGILLCDIGMPKMNGYDLARSIRAEAWGKNTVLVALTGYGQMDDLQRSADAGFDHHFVKPLGVDDLMALLAGLQPQPA
jgi:signal transduction histidine kinase